MRPNIAVVSAGGTISSINEDEHLKVAGNGQELMSSFVSRLSDGYNIRVKHTASLLSEDMHPSDWGAIANAIAGEINNVSPRPDGVVVTHGTDTLAYTASAITFMLSKVPIPIVFTGALLPAEDPKSDAHQNLADSFLLAGTSENAGVFVVFQSRDGVTRQVTLANQTVSIAGNARTFTSADGLPGGKIADGRISLPGRMRSVLPKRSSAPTEVTRQTTIDDRVKIIKIYPGLRPDDIDSITSADCVAVVLDLYHSGTACTRDIVGASRSLVPAIERCRDRKIMVFGVPGYEKYRSTQRLVTAGLVPLPRLSLEAAYTKLMWLLGQHTDQQRIFDLMQTNMRGELLGGL